MDYAGGERSDETERIADGDGEFAGTDLCGISSSDGREIGGAYAKFREVAASVARYQGRIEFAAVPELYAHLRGARDVGISDDDAVGRPDYAGAVAALTWEYEHGRAAQLLGDFAKIADGHIIRLRAGVRRRRCSLLALRRRARISA